MHASASLFLFASVAAPGADSSTAASLAASAHSGAANSSAANSGSADQSAAIPDTVASRVPAPRQVRTELDGPDALLTRGFAELHHGRLESARELLREAVRERPDAAGAYNGVGVTFDARGDDDEHKRALEADPRFGDLYYNIACLYALQGRWPRALRYPRLAALNRCSDQAQLQGDPELREIVEQMSASLTPSRAGAAP